MRKNTVMGVELDNSRKPGELPNKKKFGYGALVSAIPAALISSTLLSPNSEDVNAATVYDENEIQQTQKKVEETSSKSSSSESSSSNNGSQCSVAKKGCEEEPKLQRKNYLNNLALTVDKVNVYNNGEFVDTFDSREIDRRQPDNVTHGNRIGSGLENIIGSSGDIIRIKSNDSGVEYSSSIDQNGNIENNSFAQDMNRLFRNGEEETIRVNYSTSKETDKETGEVKIKERETPKEVDVISDSNVYSLPLRVKGGNNFSTLYSTNNNTARDVAEISAEDNWEVSFSRFGNYETTSEELANQMLNNNLTTNSKNGLSARLFSKSIAEKEDVGTLSDFYKTVDFDKIVSDESCLDRETCNSLTREQLAKSAFVEGAYKAVSEDLISNAKKQNKYTLTGLKELAEEDGFNNFLKVGGYVLPLNTANGDSNGYTGLNRVGSLDLEITPENSSSNKQNTQVNGGMPNVDVSDQSVERETRNSLEKCLLKGTNKEVFNCSKNIGYDLTTKTLEGGN